MKLMNNPKDTIQFDSSNRNLVFSWLFLFFCLKYHSAKMQLSVIWITKQFQLKVRKKPCLHGCASVEPVIILFTALLREYSFVPAVCFESFKCCLSVPSSAVMLPTRISSMFLQNIVITCLQSLKRGQAPCPFHTHAQSVAQSSCWHTTPKSSHDCFLFCVFALYSCWCSLIWQGQPAQLSKKKSTRW